MSRLQHMNHEKDPKQVIWDALGELPKDIVAKNQVLVAVYERPEMTSKGLILTAKTLEEDRYQGKVGLVVKKGELAFKDDAKYKFGGFNPSVGDWVHFRAVDGSPFIFNDGSTDGKLCRIFDDTDINGILDQPDKIY